MSRKGFWLIAILALLAGAWWAWHSRESPSVVPAEHQAQEAVVTATEAVASADKAIKKGRAILRAIPGEVKALETQAVEAARSADLGTLADRANDRIREWVRQHPTGNAIRSSDPGAGAVLAGGSGEN